jgi:hypothetical protein
MGQATTLTTLITGPARRTRGYAERLVAGITPGMAARKPVFTKAGDTITIDTNHAAFVYGHLAIYPTRIASFLGRAELAASIAPPQGWEDLFKAGAICHDDANASIYPTFDAITSHFFSATDRIIDALDGVDDAALLVPTPHEGFAKSFPILGGAVAFLLNNHCMMHLGQVSAWRRCMGLPAAV